MLALRLSKTLEFPATGWRPLLIAVLAAIVAVNAVRTTSKALKLSRTGDQTRTAFLRWRPQIQELKRGTDIYRTHAYPNPPIMALILMPLAELPPLSGMLGWFALKVLMAVLMVGMIFRIIEDNGTKLPDWAKALAIALSLHPLLGDLTHGNVNIFIAFLVFAGLDCYRRQRDLAAGLLLALAIACKITPALFVPYLAWKRAWRTLLGVGLGLGLWWAVLPGTLLGFDFNRTLLTSWFDVMVKPFVLDGQITSDHANQSLPGLLTRLLTDRPSFIAFDEEDGHPMDAGTNTIVNLGPTAVAVIMKLAMLTFAMIVVRLARSKDRGGLAFAAECGLIVLGMLLFSERTWKHHATTLLLPTAVLLAAALQSQSRRLWLIAGTIPLLSILPSAFEGELHDAAMVYGMYTISYIMMIAGMMLTLQMGLKNRQPAIQDAQILSGRAGVPLRLAASPVSQSIAPPATAAAAESRP